MRHVEWTFGITDRWVTTTHKRSNGKGGIFLAVNLAHQSSWICTEQTRIHGCGLQEIEMEGERHTYLLWLWRETLWITASYVKWVATLQWGTTQWETVRHIWERSIGMFRLNPHLIQSTKMTMKVNTADNARLDISARGLWNSCEKTFFDIRITHPTSQSYSRKSLAEIYQQHEKEKRISTVQPKSDWHWELFIQFPCLHNKWRDSTKMQRCQQKTGRKNSWKPQGAICICHNTHKGKAQICPFEEHPHCNTRIEANEVMYASRTSQTLTSVY